MAACALAAIAPVTQSVAQECAGERLGARLEITEIKAFETTDHRLNNTRDEIFIEARTQAPSGRDEVRLPLTSDPEDYYEFHTGSHSVATSPLAWTNDDGHITPPPKIWEGLLPDDGTEVTSLIVLIEQDDDSVPQAKLVLGLAFDACSTGFTIGAGAAGGDKGAESVSKACKDAKSLTEYLPVDLAQELVGVAVVSLSNNDGMLQATFVAADEEFVGSDPLAVTRLVTASAGDEALILAGELAAEGAVFYGRSPAHQGEYEFRVVAKTVCENALEPVRRKLWADDVERGTCRRGRSVDIVMPDGSRRPIEVGELLTVPTEAPWRVHYFCRDSEEDEGALFEARRGYDEFVVHRRRDKIDYYPHTIEPIAREGIVREPLLTPAPAPFRLDWRAGERRLSVGLPAAPLSACERHIAAARAGAATVPLVSWWSPRRSDNTAQTHPSWLGCEGETRSPDYGFSRVEGLVFSPDAPQPDGTIPLYRWYSGSRGDNWTTTNHADSGAVGENLSPDYGFSRLVGYVYPPNTPGRDGLVPLYSWWSPSRSDNWTSSLHAEAGAQREGLSPDYSFVRLEGFLLAP